MHVMILGATGSTGRALVPQLQSADAAVEVSAVSRTAFALPGVGRVLTGDYGDADFLAGQRRHLAHVQVLVHLAVGLSMLQSPRHARDGAMAERQIGASRRLAGTVREAQVPLLIHVSSIKAICDEDDARVLDETATARSSSLYGRSKLRLERALAEALAGSNTRLAIVRNPMMYAPGKSGSLARLLRLADTPLPLPLGGATGRRSLLAVRNLASGLAAMVRAAGLDGPQAAAGLFHVHDGAPLSTTEIVASLREALGRPRRLFALGAQGAELARRLPLVAPVARRFYGSLELSDAHFRRTFNWTPIVETRAGLAEMAAAHGETRGKNAGRPAAYHRA
ncbi:MAG TPA: NAD-dependent epimerase/dehydratase family protein [Hyphomicrobiaceae bacterium]|nr:NAD-dependent epimerase/dehydratase family protein [Hyphomicrobiaceae bacterium]